MSRIHTTSPLYVFLIFLFAGILSSCSSDDLPVCTDGAILTLEIGLPGEGAIVTRATEEGIATFNENKISSVDLFLYHRDATDNAEPLYTARLTTSSGLGDAKATFNVNVPLASFYKLFPDNTVNTCRAYVIANLPEATGTDNCLPTDGLSIANLKEKLVLYSSKFGQTTDDSPNKPEIPVDFVMDGESTINCTNRTLYGHIDVKRLAAKITLTVDCADEVTVNEGGEEVTWLPQKTQMYVSFRNGLNRTLLGMTATENLYVPDKENDQFDINNINLTTIKDNNGEITSIYTNRPFYTYPINWKTDADSRPYLVLVIQWVNNAGNGTPKTTYYEVAIDDINACLLRNCHYKITQQVSVLGSTNPNTPLILKPSYIILDWGNALTGTNQTITDADIEAMKYLVVDENRITMRNTQSKQIFFFSSDPIEITSITVKKMNVNGTTAGTVDLASKTFDNDEGNNIYTIPASGNLKKEVTIKVHEEGDMHYMSFSHELVNTMTEDADYTEYEFEIHIQHRDNDTYDETIKITQYPMIPIKAERNSDYVSSSNYNSHKGYISVNGYGNTNNVKAYNNSETVFGSVNGISNNAGNKNPNRYIISVTALTEKIDPEDTSSDFIIGDPRTLEPAMNLIKLGNNESFVTSWTQGYDGDKNTRTLQYYHPTEESERTEQMISPQFMIASSYAVTSDMDKNEARKRCATYQEDGYPAGRWRLPTEAEVKYIVQLSAWNIMPVLFGYVSTSGSYGSDAEYWCANGQIAVNSKTGEVKSSSATSASVRCVYDTWYWTDKCTKTQFTWGDKAGDLYN